MPRHRSPRYPKPDRPKFDSPTPAAAHQHRHRRAKRPRAVAARGVAVAGAVAAGAVVATQAVSLVPADFDPTRFASVAGHVAAADRAETEPAVAPAQPDLTVLEPDPAHDVKALTKGVELAEERAQRARADEGRAARSGSRPAPSQEEDDGGDDCPSSGFNGVESHVAEAGHHLQEKFDVDDVGGVAERPDNSTSDHPSGYALDFMVDSSTGDALAAYAEEHTEALGIKYILWETENHYDHVHISFDEEAGSGLSC